MENRKNQLHIAMQKIQKKIGIVSLYSSIIETKPWGITNQPLFLNQCLKVKTNYQPNELLLALQHIEKEMGKNVSYKWGPRNIDIDILFYENNIIDEEHLQIPHPYFLERQFAIQCMYEIAPNFIHPITKTTIKDILNSFNISTTT